LKPAVEKFLRHAFTTPLPIDQIARRVRLSESTVKRFWAEQKAAGTLPEVRPHFAERCKRTEPDSPAPIGIGDAINDAAPFIDKAATPIAAPNPTYVHECDMLLDALRRHHGRESIALHVMPRDWLALDVDRHFAPTEHMLARWMRARDARYVCDVRNTLRGPA